MRLIVGSDRWGVVEGGGGGSGGRGEGREDERSGHEGVIRGESDMLSSSPRYSN